jgi:hypothetical protein
VGLAKVLYGMVRDELVTERPLAGIGQRDVKYADQADEVRTEELRKATSVATLAKQDRRGPLILWQVHLTVQGQSLSIPVFEEVSLRFD